MITNRALDITPLGRLPGFCLLTRIAREQSAPGYRREVAARVRPNGIVQLTLAGCGWCRRGTGPEVPVPRGRALIFHTELHRDLTYAARPGGWSFLYADLDGAAARCVLGELATAHGHVLALDPDHPAVRACTTLLPRESLAHRAMPAAESARLGGGLLLALAEGVAGGEDPLVAAAMAWLRERLDRQVPVTACARALGVSREHLARRFAVCAGEPPARWLTRQRLARACVMLVKPGTTVAAVASACGFATPAHFAQVFRRQLGAAPRAWALSRRGAG